VTSPTELPQCLQVHRGCPPGAEPLAHAGGREGALILHGFTGSPWEVRPLADALVARGFTVAMPVLAGHVTSVHALDETHWRDWLESARQALVWLDSRCDRVHFVGMSMGSLLCLLLAQAHPPESAGRLVLLAPALDLLRWQRWGIHGLARLGWPSVLGWASALDNGAPQPDDGAKPGAYQGLPLRATRAFVELIEVVRASTTPIRNPVLALHGTADRTISHVLAERRARELLGTALQWRQIKGGGHLLLRDTCGPDVVAAAVQFLAQP
jgi:carboxylesterase